ncbi:MAG: hypothetical protein JWO85_1113 [Candidatus Eremiobacteraeota bacterium]|nr:hypothetical protein [Candidatus Eremiobacteraeota bacterium]
MQTVARVLAVLAERGADAVPHGRSSLLRHLTGTHAILERWAQPAHVRSAGLLHSVYATDTFTQALVDPSERALIRDLVGADAERLIFLFCSIERRDLFSAIAAAPDDLASTVRLPQRDNATPIDVAPAEAGDLLVLYLANEAEQSASADGSPGRWLTQTSQLAEWARTRALVVPPVFERGTLRIERDDEVNLLSAYAAAFADAEVPDATALTSSRAAQAVGEPLVLAALATLAGGDAAGGGVLARVGTALLNAWNTPWDKRLSLDRWREIAAVAIAAATADERRGAFIAERVRATLRDARTPAALHARLEGHGLLAHAVPLPPRFAAYVAGLRDDAGRVTLQRYPGLTARPWHDPATFPIVADLERLAPEIARECRALHAGAFHPESEPIARQGNWEVSLLYERGLRNDDVYAQCPVTAAAIERHRIVRGPAGLAYFSRLAPHTRIAAHAGPTNLRLRVHLALDVPPDCGLTVGGMPGTWMPGRCIVFDDAFVHDAWNDSDRERIVLIVDLWHPDLSDDEVALLEGLHGHVAGHAANLRSYWARNDEARRAAL